MMDGPDLNYLVGNTDAYAWADAFMRVRAEKPEIAWDRECLMRWFANAIMAGHDQGVKLDRERDFMEKLREIIFQCASAATRPLLEDNPDYVFPSERVVAAVEHVCETFGIPPRGESWDASDVASVLEES